MTLYQAPTLAKKHFVIVNGVINHHYKIFILLLERIIYLITQIMTK